MKKTIAILLSVLMVISSITCIFTVSAAEAENLFYNGDFATLGVDGFADGWNVTAGSHTPTMVEGTSDNLPEGEDFDFITFTKNTTSTKLSRLYNYQTIKLNTNTSYTFSYWVKTNGDATNLRFYLLEPMYITRNGDTATSLVGSEGTNVYSYEYDNGSTTRVARTEIKHLFKASNGTVLRDGSYSFATFSSSTCTTTNNEWVKVTHTFTTGNDIYHEANVRYEVYIPKSVKASEVSVGGFEATAEKLNATVVHGVSNDYNLGTVEPRNGALVQNGKATLTAVPFANNKFLGWYQGGKLVSAAKTFTFDYDSTAKYEAKFEANGIGLSDSFESYTATKLATWIDSSKTMDGSGSNGDWTLGDTYDSWREVQLNTTPTYVRSGTKSAHIYTRYGWAGRNFTGLKPNTNYSVTFYSLMEVGTGKSTNDNKYAEFNRRLENVYICDKSIARSAISKYTTDERVLAYKATIYGTGRWEKTTINFNSGSSTDVTLWMYFAASSITGQNTNGCYVDDITLVEDVGEVKDQNNDPSLWIGYETNTKIIGEGGTTASWVKFDYNTTDGDNIYPGTDGSMHITGMSYQIPTTFFNVEKNTDYILSFKYKSPDAPQNNNGYIYHFEKMIVLPIGGSPATSTTARGDVITARVLNYGYVNKAEENDWGYTSSIDALRPNDWHSFTLEFNSGDNEELAFAMKSGTTKEAYISDFSVIKAEEFVPEVPDVELNFEDPSQWERYAYGSTNTSAGKLNDDQSPHHIIATNTDPVYVIEGDTSIKLTPQSQLNLIKFGELKPNTNYLLKFSYISEAMKTSSGTSASVIFDSCGIWNYADSNAKFIPSHTASNGYLQATNFDDNYYDAFFDAAGKPSIEWYARKIPNQEAGKWYDKTFYFNSGDDYKTLSLVVILEAETAYLDDFCLVNLDDENLESAEYAAPVLSGKTSAGVYNSKSATHTLYNNVTEADFNAYKTTLNSVGFAEYATNAYGDDKFATYTKGNVTVHISYAAHNKTILVTEQITDTLPTNAEDNKYTDKGYQPLIIQIDNDGTTGGGIGMIYAIRLADGSFIMVDGGHTEKMFENANRIYNTLKKYTGDEKPVIAAWLITHAHEDHIGGFASFIEKYHNDVVIEEIVFNFATIDQYAAITSSAAGKLTYGSVVPFLLNVKAYLPDTKISTCHTGYKYNVRNAVIDVMFTLEENFPKVLSNGYNDINDSCTTFKISFTDENVDQTLLITGDTSTVQCAEMLKKYPNNELEATFVQAIHHGISYGSYELYGKMNPEIVLWPASSNRVMSVLYQSQNGYFVKEDSVKEVVCSDYGTRTFALPYTAPEGLIGLSKFTLPADMDLANTLNTYVGASIRMASENQPQALRFKFQIPEHIIRAHTEDGYSVAEYGMMVSENSSVLDYYEGNKAYINVDNSRVFKGVAYNKADNKNVVYDYVNYDKLDDGLHRSTQYTCALYNIGVTSNGSDYAKYDTTYYVRSYIAFKNANGDVKVYYGDTQSASVFAVMQEILKSTNTDDVTYVKNFLDGKVEGFTADAAAIKEAWLKDSTRASLYTPSN